jgi:hypothetical protein
MPTSSTYTVVQGTGRINSASGRAFFEEGRLLFAGQRVALKKKLIDREIEQQKALARDELSQGTATVKFSQDSRGHFIDVSGEISQVQPIARITHRGSAKDVFELIVPRTVRSRMFGEPKNYPDVLVIY